MAALDLFAAWLGLTTDEARPLFCLLPLFLIPLAIPFAFLSHMTWRRAIRRHGPGPLRP